MSYHVLITDDRAIQELGMLFHKHGHEIRLVGGAVRDILMRQIPKDYDFATTATPDEMKLMDYDSGWRVRGTGIEHGTVTLMSIWGSFEVTTLRLDVETDGRHAKVEFTTDWKADAARRDFTMNAMSMDLEGTPFDYFNGMDDLLNGRVKFVGSAADRVTEDALRIVRYFRFRAKFKDIEPVPEGVINNLHLLKNISVERVWQEVKKASENWETFFLFFKYCDKIFAEFGFHFDAVEIAKYTACKLGSYIKMFPEFAMASVMNIEDAIKFSKIFKLSYAETEKMLFFAEQKNVPLTLEYVQDLLEQGINREWIKALAQFEDLIGKWIGIEETVIDSMEQPVFPVSGKDLIDLGHKQGPEMGITLRNLKKQWKESRYTLTKEELLNGYSGSI